MDSHYSSEPILDGIEHLGHWLHIAERNTVGTAIATVKRGIVVTDDLRAQFPTLGEETAAVASDVMQCKALAAAVALAVAGGGTNLAADAGVLAALVTDGPTVIQLFTDAGKLVKTAGVDIEKDSHDLVN